MNTGLLRSSDKSTLGYLPGSYYPCIVGPGVAHATTTLVLNRLYLIPWTPLAPVSVDRLQVNVSTGAGSAFVRVGIYADDGYGRPGSLIHDAGQVDASTSGAKDVIVSLLVERDLYWLAAAAQGVTATLRTFSSNVTSYVSPATDITSSSSQAYYQDSVSAGLPPRVTITDYIAAAPRFHFQAAA